MHIYKYAIRRIGINNEYNESRGPAFSLKLRRCRVAKRFEAKRGTRGIIVCTMQRQLADYYV